MSFNLWWINNLIHIPCMQALWFNLKYCACSSSHYTQSLDGQPNVKLKSAFSQWVTICSLMAINETIIILSLSFFLLFSYTLIFIHENNNNILEVVKIIGVCFIITFIYFYFKILCLIKRLTCWFFNFLWKIVSSLLK